MMNFAFKFPLSSALFVAVLLSGPAGAGLVGHWDFEEGSGSTAYDSSGNGYDGTINGATRITGQFGGGLYFDGSDSVVIDNSSALAFAGANAFSLSMWIQAPGSTGCCGQLAGFRNTVGWDLRYDIRDARPLEMLVAANGSYYGDAGSLGAQISDQQWHNVAVVVNNNLMEMYVDNVLNHSYGFSGVLSVNSASNLIFGSAGDGNYIGAMDEVRLYDHALTAGELSALQFNESTGARVPLPAPMALLMLGFAGWRFLAFRANNGGMGAAGFHAHA